MTKLTATETKLLATLRARGPLTNAQLREATGATLTTARLRKLIPANLVRIERQGRGYLFTTIGAQQPAPAAPKRTGFMTPAQNFAHRIRDAYAKSNPSKYLGTRLATLRGMVVLSPAQFDMGIRELAGQAGVHVRSEADQKTLTDACRAGGVVLGGTVRHDLYIEG